MNNITDTTRTKDMVTKAMILVGVSFILLMISYLQLQWEPLLWVIVCVIVIDTIAKLAGSIGLFWPKTVAMSLLVNANKNKEDKYSIQPWTDYLVKIEEGDKAIWRGDMWSWIGLILLVLELILLGNISKLLFYLCAGVTASCVFARVRVYCWIKANQTTYGAAMYVLAMQDLLGVKEKKS